MNRLDELFKQISGGAPEKTSVTHLVVGLGNPGKEYEKTRHNMGFMALDTMAAKYGASVTRLRFHALTGDACVEGTRVLFMKPETFMNLSGEAVAEAASFYKISPENILVFCDDISFPVGRFRLRKNGSAGGHNGLKSIIASLGSDAFPRVKLGVGQKPTPEYDLADWVLSKLPTAELPTAARVFDAVSEALPLLLKKEYEKAQTLFSKALPDTPKS